MSQKEKREPLGVVSPRAMSPSESDLLTTVTTYESNEPHHIRVPDSGRRAWLVVFGGFLNFIASFGLLVISSRVQNIAANNKQVYSMLLARSSPSTNTLWA